MVTSPVFFPSPSSLNPPLPSSKAQSQAQADVQRVEIDARSNPFDAGSTPVIDLQARLDSHAAGNAEQRAMGLSAATLRHYNQLLGQELDDLRAAHRQHTVFKNPGRNAAFKIDEVNELFGPSHVNCQSITASVRNPNLTDTTLLSFYPAAAATPSIKHGGH